MSPEPLVFIIIVNWNGKAVTIECLESVRELSYNNVKTIVVDNASNDGSVDAIRERFPHVIVLQMDRNLRFAGGTNAGIRYGLEHNGSLFLLLNNDTTVDSRLLSAMVDQIASSNTIGVVAPKIYYHAEPDRIWFAGGKISMWTGTMKHIGIREMDVGQYNMPVGTGYATGCCMLVKREVIERAGMLDEAFSMYAEDADWSIRIHRAGFTLMYEPKAKVWHKVSVSSGGHLSLFKTKHKFFSNMRFFARHASWYHWFVFPWANILVNGYAAAKYLVSSTKKQ